MLGFHNSYVRDPDQRPYVLEQDFCTCMVAMLMEGWKALASLGGNDRFLRVANAFLQVGLNLN
jgi:predicted nucleic acid-binding Zn finger protein